MGAGIDDGDEEVMVICVGKTATTGREIYIKFNHKLMIVHVKPQNVREYIPVGKVFI